MWQTPHPISATLLSAGKVASVRLSRRVPHMPSRAAISYLFRWLVRYLALCTLMIWNFWMIWAAGSLVWLAKHETRASCFRDCALHCRRGTQPACTVQARPLDWQTGVTAWNLILFHCYNINVLRNVVCSMRAKNAKFQYWHLFYKNGLSIGYQYMKYMFFPNIFQDCIQPFGHEMLSWVRLRGINAPSVSTPAR